MVALIKREFLRNKTSFIVYCIISVCTVWLYISLFPSIQEQSKELSDLMNSMPDAMMKAFGIDKNSFSSIEPYLAVELMSIFWPLMAILLSTSRAGSCIAGDIENRTLELELSLPIPRTRIYISKIIGGLSAVFVFCTISIFSILPICFAYGIEIRVSRILILYVLCLLFSSSVFSSALFVSSFVSEKGKVFFSVGGVLLISYLGNIVANISSGISWVKNFSIFHYYDPIDVLTTGNIELSSIVFFVFLVLLTLTIGLYRFRSRDISI